MHSNCRTYCHVLQCPCAGVAGVVQCVAVFERARSDKSKTTFKNKSEVKLEVNSKVKGEVSREIEGEIIRREGKISLKGEFEGEVKGEDEGRVLRVVVEPCPDLTLQQHNSTLSLHHITVSLSLIHHTSDHAVLWLRYGLSGCYCFLENKSRMNLPRDY